MTRKKYIKVLMSLGAQRNEANRLAEYQRLQHGSYTDIRTDGWPSLHLFGLRCAVIAQKIVEKVTDAVMRLQYEHGGSGPRDRHAFRDHRRSDRRDRAK